MVILYLLKVYMFSSLSNPHFRSHKNSNGREDLISINLFLILISKFVPLTPEPAMTLDMFIRLRVMLLRAIENSFLIHGFAQ